MRRDLFQDVADFQNKFGVPANSTPGFMPPDVEKFRTDFLQEELTEFVDACRSRCLADAADALCDLVYIALGNAHLMGIPFNECWDEVQRANMSKVRATSADDPLSKRKHSYDVVKPPGWKPPDIQGVLDRSSRATPMEHSTGNRKYLREEDCEDNDEGA